MLKRLKKIGDRIVYVSTHLPLYQFIFKSFLLLLPCVLCLGYVEYRLSTMSVSYSQKKHELESQLKKIEVLVIGSSNAYYGINPHFFSKKGFNLAYRGQWPYYDWKFIQKYINLMPNLKLVIFSANYFTLGTHPLKHAEDWRIYFYAQYHRILPPQEGTVLGFRHSFDPKLFSKIALFGEKTKYYLENGSTQVDAGEPSEDMTGWFNAGTKPCDLTLNIGSSGAAAHNASVNPSNFQMNLSWVAKIAKKVREKNIKLVILELPESHYYTDNLDPNKTALMEESIQNFAKLNKATFITYLNDARFDLKDYTDMPDHLNAVGAEKISRIIDHDIIVPVMKVSA